MNLFQIEALLNIDYKVLIIFSTIYLILFGIAEVAYHGFDVNVEYTRKFVHLCTGLIALLFPLYIPNPLDLMILCGGFMVVVLLTNKYNILLSVNAIQRSSRGSVLFPIVVVICYLFEYYMENYVYFFIPILVLAFADPVAALVGKKWPKGKYSFRGNLKTLSGTTAFVFTAFVISSSSFYLIENAVTRHGMIFSFTIAIFAAIGEALSVRGYDNLLIPLCCIGTLLIFQV